MDIILLTERTKDCKAARNHIDWENSSDSTNIRLHYCLWAPIQDKVILVSMNYKNAWDGEDHVALFSSSGDISTQRSIEPHSMWYWDTLGRRHALQNLVCQFSFQNILWNTSYLDQCIGLLSHLKELESKWEKDAFGRSPSSYYQSEDTVLKTYTCHFSSHGYSISEKSLKAADQQCP